MDANVLAARERQVLYDVKWKRLLRRARVFRYLPFIDVVFVSGSMATGDVKPTSDFDLIVGCRYGRLFTARFFLILTLDFLGWRRRNLDHHSAAAADTLCLNHFITERSLRLAPPQAGLWKTLYRSLVPIFGDQARVVAFWKANEDWMDAPRPYADDLRHSQRRDSILKNSLERRLGGRAGDWFERFVRAPQLRRIERKLVPLSGYKPRLIATDEELELHLETRPGYE